jgi:hypothetical protein
MSHPPSLAVVLDGDLVLSLIVQDWPAQLPPPRVVVVDYDIDGANEDELTHFSVAGSLKVARCYGEIPDRYEDCKAVLSPTSVWEALGWPLDAARPDPIAQSLTDFLKGYIGNDPDRREQVRNFPDWPDRARRELDRRSARFLETLPDDALRAIARGEVDLVDLAGKIPV